MSKFKTSEAVVNYLTNLIFKKEIQKKKGIPTLLPENKVNAEKKARFIYESIKKRGNIDADKLTTSELDYLAESAVNPIKTAEKTVVKSADIVPFPFKRNFAEELAAASKKGDFNRMSGIMKVDPKFKEVIKAYKKSKADEALADERALQTKLIPLDTIQYQSPPIQKLSSAEKQKYLITNDKQTAEIMKKGYTFDDIIYAQDNYGMRADEIVEAAKSGEKFPFADGGVAGLLGERVPMFIGGKVGAGILKLLKNKKKVKAAYDDIFPSGDYKYDAEMVAESLVENNPRIFKNRLYSDLTDAERFEVYGAALNEASTNFAKALQLKRSMDKASKPTKTLKSIEETGTIDISDDAIASEFATFMKETDPVGHAKIQKVVDDANQKLELQRFKTKDRKKNASGGIAKLLGE